MSDTQFVVSRLGDQHYGIRISDVNQIIRSVEPTPIPGMHGNIEGIINLRGHIVPVVDIRPMFGVPPSEASRDSRIVVVSIQDHDIGLYVDAVSEVLAVDDEIIETPDNLVLDFDSTYLTGIAKLDERLILLLDLNAALDILELPEELELAAA